MKTKITLDKQAIEQVVRAYEFDKKNNNPPNLYGITVEVDDDALKEVREKAYEDGIVEGIGLAREMLKATGLKITPPNN